MVDDVVAVRAEQPTDASDARSGVVLMVTIMVLAMVAGSLVQFTFGALAPVLLDELSIQRSQLGLLQSVLFLVGGVTSPRAGLIADSRGARVVFVATFAAGAAALLLLAASQNYLWCVGTSICGGLAAACANPATNKLIATEVAARRQGTIVGIKQSGVQVSAVIVGVVVPVLVAAVGWRGAVAVLALVPAAMILVAWRRIRPATVAEHHGDAAPTKRARSTASVRILTLYALLMGMATASFSIYIPLYGYEGLDLTLGQTGFAVALTGAVGVAGRVLVPQAFESDTDFGIILAILGVVGCTAVALLLAARPFGIVFFWVGVVLCGFTTSWNAVAMLAVMRRSSRRIAGVAAGMVQRGFFLGVMLTPPILGLIVDRSGGYTGVWIVVGVLFLCGSSIATAGRPRLLYRPGVDGMDAV